MRLFITMVLCIWAVILSFAWFAYRQEKNLRAQNIIDRIDLANGNVVEVYEHGGDVQRVLRFMHHYLQDSYLHDMSIQVYDTNTQRMLYSTGNLRHGMPKDISEEELVMLPDSSRVVRRINTRLGKNEKLYFYSSRISPDGQIEIRTYLPHNPEITKELTIGPMFWVLLIIVGALGTTLSYIITSHHAKNVMLLHDFATRAANDVDFYPTDVFPKDEIGEISRQIVSIYNSRMQAVMRREQEHNITLKVIEEKNKMKRVLTDNISHELKTPIGIIRAYVDMMLTQDDMPEADRKRFLEKTQVNVERLVSMMNDLSTMTRLEETAGNLPMKDIDMYALMFNICDEIESSGLLKGARLCNKLPRNCIVTGNETVLNSVIQNLIKNAVAYSQGTEIGLELIGETETYYTFSFYDNGVGVGEEHLPHLFDRFYRVDSGRSRKSGGTGLGLPIVKGGINRMGGSISVRNRAEGGLEFIFTLSRPKRNN